MEGSASGSRAPPCQVGKYQQLSSRDLANYTENSDGRRLKRERQSCPLIAPVHSNEITRRQEVLLMQWYYSIVTCPEISYGRAKLLHSDIRIKHNSKFAAMQVLKRKVLWSGWETQGSLQMWASSWSPSWMLGDCFTMCSGVTEFRVQRSASRLYEVTAGCK